MNTLRSLFAVLAVAGPLCTESRVEAAPRKIFAMANGFSNAAGEVANNPSDTIMFYDVTDVGQPGATGIFNNSPLFSVWTGYEIFEGEVGDLPGGMPRGNREEISALTFNPANGTVYVASFDSGTPGFPDPVGDNQGDFDLYRIDYQKILADYEANNRPRGTIYAPSTLRISMDDESFLESIGSPLYDGTVDGVAHSIPHPTALTSTVFIDGALTKIGEVGRAQSPFSFFDEEIDFINPETFVFLDGATTTDAQATSNPAGDFQIRAWQRVSTSPGLATMNKNGPDGLTGPPGSPNSFDDEQGGYNGNGTQSWKSTIMGRLQMDQLDRSEPSGWAFVRRDGKLGVWVADNEAAGAGEQVSYFELDFSGATPTATKKVLPTSADGSLSFRVDENPAVDGTTNDGEIDFLAIDKDGNLVIGESGFFDTIEGSTTPPLGSNGLTARQPRVLTVGIESYSDAAGVLPAGYTASGGSVTFDSSAPWTVSASIPEPAADDDNQVINTTRVAYDRGTGYIYIIEQDADFFEDIYVFDPVSGTLVYSEINGLNPSLFNAGTQIVFTRGDIDGNGVVNQADVAALQAGIADPTLGGTVSATVGAEWYDLTGDGLLNNDDFIELTTKILDAAPIPGDFNGDGNVDGVDLQVWKDGYGTTYDGNDFLVWQQNLGSVASAAAGAAVPEPAGALMAGLAIGATGAAARRRRR